MQHQIYPDRFNDDGEFVPAVIVEVPDTLYLQVVDTDDCEDWPAPSEPDERTHCDERINSSDVAYVPLARAERAEADAEALRAQLDEARATLASAVTVSIGGALHRVLPAPVGYSGDSETVWRVEHGDLVVQQFGLSKAAPGDGDEEAG